MKTKILLLTKIVFVILSLFIISNANAQVSNSFTVNGWQPICNNGNDGFIRVAGMSGGTQPYTVRIVGGSSDDTAVITFSGIMSTTFDITNLSPGTYWVDYTDAISSSTNKQAIVVNPPVLLTEVSLIPLTVQNVSLNTTCTDPYLYRIGASYLVPRSGQTITLTATNNLNVTLTSIPFVINRQPNITNHSVDTFIDIPTSFFNGAPINIQAQSSCGNSSAINNFTDIPTALSISNHPNFIKPQSVSCSFGFNLNRKRRHGINPITAVLTEVGNPSPLNYIGAPLITNFNNNIQYAASGISLANGGTTIFENLKYDTNYHIIYTDACGSIFEENINITSAPIASSNTAVCRWHYHNYTQLVHTFLDNSFSRIELSVPQTQTIFYPLTITVNSGPLNWSSNIIGPTITPAPTNINYGAQTTFIFNSPSVSGGVVNRYGLGINDDFRWPNGNYNITFLDACGNENTFDVNLGCAFQSSTSYTFNYCNQNDGSSDITYTLSGNRVNRHRFSLYDALNNLVASNLTTFDTSSVDFTGIQPGTYKIRFGGVDQNGDIVGFTNMNPLVPRLKDGYIYEEEIVVLPLSSLSFSSLGGCNNTITASGQGGQAPYNYFLFTDATETTRLAGPQAIGTFTGLVIGNTYYLKAIDACGQSLGELVSLFPTPTTPAFTLVTQPTCATLGSVTFTGMPTGNWELNQTGTSTRVINGTGAQYTLTGLVEGVYAFTVSNVITPLFPSGCTSPITANITINAQLQPVKQIGIIGSSCSTDGRTYTLTTIVEGVAPFTATGTGAPGAFVNNGDGVHTWTSDAIAIGTSYSVDFQDREVCNTLTIAAVSPSCCIFEVTCPTFPTTTVECYTDLPSTTTLTETEFQDLGNGDGVIGDISCGVIEITVSNSTDLGACQQTVIRTYTIIQYEDSNNNDTRDVGENTVLNTSECIQIITIQDTTAPVFTSELPQHEFAGCDNIPVAQTLTAIDNCGTVTIAFEEERVEGDCLNRYELIRTWTASDDCGNSTSHTQIINLACYIKVWNALSPNGDGSNDFFFLEGIDCYPNNTVEVYNRLGIKVYEAQGYDNISNVFSGYSDGRSTISRNNLLPTGTYFYILKYEYSFNGFNGIQNMEKSGYLYIINK